MQVWKIGALASATGLTVRTLHHYDHIGLVSPSGRTPSGHRLYEEADVQRLYQVLALRQLGLPLDKVGAAISGHVSLPEILAAHRGFLGDQLAATAALHARVGAVASTLGRRPGAPVEDFLGMIQKVVAMNDMATKYFDEEQLADLAERRDRLGDEAIDETQAGWAELLPQVTEAVESGMDPASSEAQRLAARWMQLLERFHGGDDGLRDGLYRMQAGNATEIEQQHGGPSPAQLEFIRAANAAGA